MYIYICSLNGRYRSVSPAGHGEIWVEFFSICELHMIHLLQFIFLNVCVVVSPSG